MRTLLIEVAQIEKYVMGQMATPDQLLMEGKLLVNPELNEKAKWQKKAYRLIHHHGRNELKIELEDIHSHLFSSPKYESFAQSILRFFKK